MTLTHANPKLGRFLGYKDVYTFFGVLVVMFLTFFWAQAGIIGCFVATLFWIIPYRDIERLFAKSDN
ncbi:hypothetical protein SIN07_07495 [Pediococcus inopinatus]|uniref:Integral membrane protein n=2 Tax=Pediococcus inopinatus TaxID=114090 RepID=A0ABZ0Q5I3_9LACO|nr:hypothetical protein [Pediococcus inopinatus]KRN62149.1 hypothetical protein IV83_GL000382 [Pediococcus inopinatus]WPC20521.1 hypothetical protein N6G95_04865 [Pediococcus inopinatus]WPC22224.1 hypothetical protein N6G96_03100 [Pediococcus inopinatus]WPP08846.1 hypothetical protein SIN07_07495 [Pediococcus inopinatus]